MSTIRLGILGSAAALAMALPAGAQSYGYPNDYNGYDDYGYDNYGYQQPNYQNTNCDAQRRSNQGAGTIVGAIAGGLIGAAIADDDDDGHRRRGHRYSRGWDRGYGYGYRGRGHHRDNDNGDQVAGAVIGAIVGGVAGNALASSATNCNTRAYAPGYDQRYGNTQVAPPTRQAYGSNGWGNTNTQPVTYGQQTGYSNNAYNDLRPGEELYGSQYDPGYGATTSGYNSGYTTGYDSGECRTVYRDRYINGQRVSEPATACNVGGDRWEFVD